MPRVRSSDHSTTRVGQLTAAARLVLVAGEVVLSRSLVNPSRLTIGRGADADVSVDHGALSRLHALVRLDDAGVFIEDLGSTNGTRVRGAPLSPRVAVPLGPGEAADLGGVLVIIEGVAPRSNPHGERAADSVDDVYSLADRVARSSLGVVILGETGVGKGVLAARIHEKSSRSRAPFVPVNCAALPEALVEGELFGVERGAFTGALDTRAGLVERAHGGTLFLDEVGELTLSAQAKLLKVIEESAVRRLGGRDAHPADVRWVAATNRDLEECVEAGRFRADLFYRLSGVVLRLPPLRERRGEIPELARRFFESAARSHGLEPGATLSPAALEWLVHQPWPGNIRELRHAVERAVVLARGPVVEVDDLARVAPRRQSETPPPRVGPTSRPPPSEPDERAEIVTALERFAGNQTRAARALGMSRTTLSARLDAHGLVRPRKRS